VLIRVNRSALPLRTPDEQRVYLMDWLWSLRGHRAYERRVVVHKRAERQYDACDPENRVVARTLETRWNEKLAELERLEREVGVTQIDVPRRMLRLRLLWHTQAVTDIEVDLPVPRTRRKSLKWRVVETTAPLALGAAP
jgi:hypothetical protein